MKLAFISDIHGNFSALSAVLKEIKKLNINKIYCLGDIVNYYYDSDKCIDLLLKYNVKSIKGNHEKILFETYKNKLKFEKYSLMYGNSIKINHRKLKIRHIEFLKSLKYQKKLQIDGEKILLAHGAPWKNNFYFYPNVKKKWFNKISNYDYKYFILGHTHISMIKKLKKKKILINPGSVGQPRNNIKGAQWMIFDTITKRILLKKTLYPLKKIKNQISKYDPNNKRLLKYFK